MNAGQVYHGCSKEARRSRNVVLQKHPENCIVGVNNHKGNLKGNGNRKTDEIP